MIKIDNIEEFFEVIKSQSDVFNFNNNLYANSRKHILLIKETNNSFIISSQITYFKDIINNNSNEILYKKRRKAL